MIVMLIGAGTNVALRRCQGLDDLIIGRTALAIGYVKVGL